jgi:hypothetical protein
MINTGEMVETDNTVASVLMIEADNTGHWCRLLPDPAVQNPQMTLHKLNSRTSHHHICIYNQIIDTLFE